MKAKSLRRSINWERSTWSCATNGFHSTCASQRSCTEMWKARQHHATRKMIPLLNRQATCSCNIWTMKTMTYRAFHRHSRCRQGSIDFPKTQSPLIDRGDCSIPISKLQTFIQVVVQIIPAKLFLEFVHAGILVDQQELNACHLSKISQMLGSDRITEARVMRTTRIDPRGSGNLEIGPRQP